MALVVIKLRDEGKNIEIKCESEPVFKMDNLTDAQRVALDMLDSAVNSAEKVHTAKADGVDIPGFVKN